MFRQQSNLPSYNDFIPTLEAYVLGRGDEGGGPGNLGVIAVRLCEPVFQNLPHSYTWPLKKRTHSYTWSSEMLTYSEQELRQAGHYTPVASNKM